MLDDKICKPWHFRFISFSFSLDKIRLETCTISIFAANDTGQNKVG